MLKVCPECKSDEHLSLIIQRHIQRDVDDIYFIDEEDSAKRDVAPEWTESDGNMDIITKQKVIGVSCRRCAWYFERYDDGAWWNVLLDEDASLEDPEEGVDA